MVNTFAATRHFTCRSYTELYGLGGGGGNLPHVVSDQYLELNIYELLNNLISLQEMLTV